ncbi:MAG: TIGR00730 family Rossman fold protein [Pelodictyon luteolum]|uniref:Cytokinin riboside 5'-monophosphate phosphoribohydrolase n=1 Tax=Pelodictyon luteolum TaxID=1100 RepID=A0A165L3C6_PELLU|nr:TIGR00730 family Rossman fold protein [Pelodictyon luteolum]KZK73524.1 MAG: TIGR00730 family Rossman fold protein [Pelodictyon luteolum]
MDPNQHQPPSGGRTPSPLPPPLPANGHEGDFMVDGWRVFKIMAEFVSGFEVMADAGPAVSVFGSTRVAEGSGEYLQARRIGGLLAEEGLAVVTGGGPGVMEAANRGAQEAGGSSIGFNIKLPNQQTPNSYIDPGRLVGFQYFFVRKVMFLKYSQAFIALPGGFGTLDEVSEAITLIQTGKSARFPVILVGKSYWDGLYRWICDTMLRDHGFISPSDLGFIYLVDTPEEVLPIIRTFYPEGYSLNF